MDTLVALGQALGLAGVGAGIFFLLFRDVIRKNIFPQMDRERGFKLLKTIMLYVFIFSLVVVVLATGVQLLRNGTFSVSGNLKSGDTAGSFNVSFQSYTSILAARAAELEVDKQRSGARISMNLAESFQRYSSAATAISNLAATLRSAPPYRDLITVAQLRSAELGLQRGEAGGFEEIFSKSVAASANAPKETKAQIAEIGFLAAQMEELTFRFDKAEQTYRKVLGFSPRDLSAARSYATLLAERGDYQSASNTIDALVSDVRTNEPSNSLLLSRALTIQAEMNLWKGNFAGVEQSLGEADAAAVSESIGQTPFRLEMAARLNTAAGLYANMGEVARAVDKVRNAIDIYTQEKSVLSLINCKMNLGAILLEGGQIKMAAEIVQELDSSQDRLASGDPLRGYLLLLKVNLYLKTRNLEAAELSAARAADFYSGFDANAQQQPLRAIRLRCLVARLHYLKEEWDDALKGLQECVRLMPLATLARVPDIIEAKYLLWKASLLSKHTVPGEAVFDSKLPVAPALSQRVSLIEEFAKAYYSIDQRPSQMASELTHVIAELVAHEGQTGYVSDALTDALYLRKHRTMDGVNRLTVVEMNDLRQSVGARMIVL